MTSYLVSFTEEKIYNDLLLGFSGDIILENYTFGFEGYGGYQNDFFAGTFLDVGIRISHDEDSSLFANVGADFVYIAEKGLLGPHIRVHQRGKTSIVTGNVGFQCSIFGGDSDVGGSFDDKYIRQCYFTFGIRGSIINMF